MFRFTMSDPLDIPSLHQFIDSLDKTKVCPGNSGKFVALAASRKDKKFLSTNGHVRAYLEESFPIMEDSGMYASTIRTSLYTLLVNHGQCKHCKEYRPQLIAMLSHHSRSATNSQPKKYVNNKYLSTPQKQKQFQNLKSRAYAAERKVQKLRERISRAVI